MVVYEEAGGQEHTWLLEHTSPMEVIALLMQGRFKDGRRIIVEAEVALEPPEDSEERPHLCFMADRWKVAYRSTGRHWTGCAGTSTGSSRSKAEAASLAVNVNSLQGRVGPG